MYNNTHIKLQIHPHPLLSLDSITTTLTVLWGWIGEEVQLSKGKGKVHPKTGHEGPVGE
jgi:hypothetical protein